MKAILPGRPQSKLQALCTAYWEDLRVIAYISGNAIIILKSPQEILQTIYVDEVDELEAATIEEVSGRIAVCSQEHVYIYGPVGRDEGVLKWSRTEALDCSTIEPVSTLSWGSSEELLIGGKHLALWNIPDSGNPTCIWNRQLANPVKIAQFSHDAGLIATSVQYGRLVKVWRRLSYELDSTRFDVSYLSHPAAITNMHWRKPWHVEQNLDNLLYTFCADNTIRVWAHSDLHAISVMQYVAAIDMNSSIQPRRLSIGSMSTRRYGFIIDSRDFSQTTEKAVQNGPSSGVDYALEHLIEIANRSPEICVVLDGLGHMSAWGLENAGCKNKKPTTVFNVAHVDGMNVDFGASTTPTEDYAQVCVFAGRLADSTLTILAHTFDGKIDWYDTKITEMFDPSSRSDRARLVLSWTGHDAKLSSIVAAHGGSVVGTVDEEEGVILWNYDENRLLRKSRIVNDDEILQVILAAEGKHVALLHPESISIWNTGTAGARMLEKVKHSSRNRSMYLVKVGSVPDIHLSLIDTSGMIETWRLPLPIAKSNSSNGATGNDRLLIKSSVSQLNGLLDVIHISPIVGQSLNDQVAIAITRTGLMQVLSCALRNDTDGVIWSPAKTFSTNDKKCRIVRAVSSGKVVFVNDTGTRLSIWDMGHGWLEYEHNFKGIDIVEQVAWTTTQVGQSILAIGMQFRIVFLAQTQFSVHSEQPAWIQVHDIRMRDFATHALGDLCWLQGGDLLIGTGGQLFLQEVKAELDGRLEKYLGGVKHPNKQFDIVRLVSEVNASLAIFHPTYLHHLISLGRSSNVLRILNLLYEKLKYWSDGEQLPSDLGLEPMKAIGLYSADDTEKHNGNLDNDDQLFDEEKAGALSDYLASSALPQLSASARGQLGQFIKQVAALERYQRSVDENATRYLFLSNMSFVADEALSLSAPYRDIIFASRSGSQDILVDHLTRSAQGKLTWSHARRSGLFMWLADPEAVYQQLEIIARNEYTNSDDRSPVGCSLYYLALRKKNVLQGLWRLAPGLREQKNTLKLLANDFEDAKWRTSALKNAYVLLSKRRFMYAAAFFLLGGALKDAVNVCVHQLKDVQLAVAITRAYAGDDSPVLKSLLADQILPDAVERGDRWCASWIFGMLGLRKEALQALVRPLYTLLEGVTKAGNACCESTQAKHWQNYDPMLAVLYRQLRAGLATDSRAAYLGGLTEKEEWDFVLKCAAQYTRMGCDWLALDMVRNWEFLPGLRKQITINEAEESVQVVEEEEEVGRDKAMNEPEPVFAEREKPPPTQFQEPSASSLLDSFGF